MIELPEAVTLAGQMDKALAGKTVKTVYPPSSEHKFTWFHGDLETYGPSLQGQRVEAVTAFGIYVEISFTEAVRLNFNDGVNPRLFAPGDKRPAKYQLMLEFTDGDFLVFTVAMYGGFACHKGDFDNPYYVKSRMSISPLSDAFDYDYFLGLFEGLKPSVSAKVFLAAEQRIPGVGNGVLQDILFACRIHPKTKAAALSPEQKQAMFGALKQVLKQMTEQGGRDTEKDLYGRPGGYQTILSRKTLGQACPRGDGIIEKQAYMGGAVYFCSGCQPLQP